MESQNIEISENLYDEIKKDFEHRTFESNNADTWESCWFTINDPCTEDMRMLIVVVLMVYELSHDNITPEMLGELGYYYDEAFNNNTLYNYFADEDKDAFEECKKDLLWCYNTAKEKHLL